MEGNHGQSVLLEEVVIEPNVKLEYVPVVPKFYYLSDTLDTEGSVEEAARVRVRCAWAKFKNLSPTLTARGTAYHTKASRARYTGSELVSIVQSVLIYIVLKHGQ